MSDDGIEVIVACQHCSVSTALGCVHCNGTGRIRTTTLEVPAEVVRLRERITAHCERIAAASEVIAKNAERSPLARLEAWLAVDSTRRVYNLSAPRVQLTEYVSGREPREVTVWSYPVSPNYACWVVGIGTPDKPATLADCIDAALALWHELYGKE